MVTTYNTLLTNTLDTRDPIGSKKSKFKTNSDPSSFHVF